MKYFKQLVKRLKKIMNRSKIRNSFKDVIIKLMLHGIVPLQAVKQTTLYTSYSYNRTRRDNIPISFFN